MKSFQDNVYGNFDYPTELEGLIKSYPIQRLGRIKQLGLLEKVYPSGVGSRLSHSLGVMFLMKQFFAEIWNKSENQKKEFSSRRSMDKKNIKGYDYWVNVASLSGLLHDLGHGPFSHAFEEIIKPIKHDKHLTLAIIRNKLITHDEVQKTEKEKDLSKNLSEQLNDVLNIFDLVYNNNNQALDSYNQENEKFAALIICRLLSGAFDVDKLDYLMRDRVHIGFGYNSVDFDWLLKNINFHFDEKVNSNSHLFFEEDACTALDEFIFSRISLYWKCIYHRKVRLFEIMLIKLLTFLIDDERYKAIFKDTNNSQCLSFFKTCIQIKNTDPKNINVDDFLKLDDSIVLEVIKQIRNLCDSSWKGVKIPKVEKTLLNALTLPFVDSKSTYHSLYEVYAQKDKMSDEVREKIRRRIFEHYDIPENSRLFPYFFFSDQPELKGHITKERQDIKIRRRQIPIAKIEGADKYFDLLEKSQISQLFSGGGQLVHRYYVLDDTNDKSIKKSIKMEVLEIQNI